MERPKFLSHTQLQDLFVIRNLPSAIFLTLVEKKNLGSLWSSQDTDARCLPLDGAAQPFS